MDPGPLLMLAREHLGQALIR
jgi:hypothetical protein